MELSNNLTELHTLIYSLLARINFLETLYGYKYQEAVLAFAFVECVPFTNNLAEQAIRNVKIKQKIAVFRTEKEAKAYARIQEFINTVKKTWKKCFPRIAKSKD